MRQVQHDRVVCLQKETVKKEWKENMHHTQQTVLKYCAVTRESAGMSANFDYTSHVSHSLTLTPDPVQSSPTQS
jgi:hypothetical protein